MQPTAPEIPSPLQLVRMVDTAINAAFHDCGLTPPPNDLAKVDLIAELINRWPGQPVTTILLAYFAARSRAVCLTAPRTELKDETDWFTIGFNDWLDTPSAKAQPLPTPCGQIDSRQLAILTQSAITSGFAAEGQDSRYPPSRPAGKTAKSLAKAHLQAPHSALLQGYFGSRGAAIAARLGRSATEDPDRYFRQAALNWRAEITAIITQNNDNTCLT